MIMQTSCVITIYKRYVDDIFLVFKERENMLPFLSYMNSLHSNIVFTVELEKNGVLPFLDLLIERKGSRYETEIYRKKTDTGLYTTTKSFCEPKYNRSMIKGLLFRCWSLSSTYEKADASIDKLTELLQKNGYSKSFLEKLTNETIDKLMNKEHEGKDELKPDKLSNENSNIGYTLIVPYSEGYKKFKSSILKSIDSKNLNLKIISKSYKIQSMFSNKSHTPLSLCSNLVYQFSCNGCNATYIGETSRHLCKRIQEHGRLGNGSNIAGHMKVCRSEVKTTNFKILCSNFKNYWERVTCEALLIKSLNPSINVQTSLSSTLLKIFN